MTRLRLRSDVTWREADDEVLAVDPRMRNYASTNASGRVLWKALAEGATREELTARLVETFGIDRRRAEPDVDAFVAELRANGFLEA